MIDSKRFVICAVYLLITLCFSPYVSGTELIGVMPFANQRYQKQEDWLGYFIQARIQANLTNNSDWQFYPQNVLSLWSLRLDRSLPISPQTTILIEGSYQRVAAIGYISLKVRRYNQMGKPRGEFEKSFDFKNLEKTVDELSVRVGRWIDSGFTLRKTASFPVFKSDITQTVFNLRKKLFLNEGMPVIREILYLEDKVNENSPYPVICDLTESMLINARLLKNQEQKMVYSRVEALLRKAILQNKNRARLYILLAEVYYLRGGYSTWIEKTADDAIQLGDLSGVGYLLKEIVSEPKETEDTQNIERLNQINPWLLSGKINAPEVFQKGLLKKELLHLMQKINRTEEGAQYP